MSETASVGGFTVLWDMVDGPMPRGVLGLGDPNVHVIDGVLTMFLGGFSTSFKNRLYTATLDRGADPASASWRVDTDARGRALALTDDPPRGAWDGKGMHTPCYVPATDAHPARIYYTGRSSTQQYGPRSSYSIGALDLRDGVWVRRERPVMQGVAPRGNTLEPRVVHDQGRYMMWYQANPHEIGPGERPDYEIRVVDSEDGISWSEPTVFTTPQEGFFDNAIARTRDGWVMVLARGSDLHGTGDFPPQGLWVSTARELSADRDAWSALRPVLDTSQPDVPRSFGRGTYGPGILHDAAQGRTVIYATGVREVPSWPRLLLHRALRGQRLVVPAPFYLSVAAMNLGRRDVIERPPHIPEELGTATP